jgi:energy-coupling factor transporter ATP-binding protein EcfA2
MAAVEIESFSYSYATGPAALSDVSLKIEHGERVAIIGPNGAGKSTLLLAIGGFLKGTGRIAIEGMEYDRANTKRIRRILGGVMQDPDDQLFMPTVFEDVAFGPLNMGMEGQEVRAAVERALSEVGLAGMGDRPPHHLSAGQKRAAAIATILAMSPHIIMMDEPDSNLDPRSRNNLIGLLNGLDQTLIIATCNMSFAARVCKRAVLVDYGRVIADGPAAEVIGRRELMEEHGLEAAPELLREKPLQG